MTCIKGGWCQQQPQKRLSEHENIYCNFCIRLLNKREATMRFCKVEDIASLIKIGFSTEFGKV